MNSIAGDGPALRIQRRVISTRVLALPFCAPEAQRDDSEDRPPVPMCNAAHLLACRVLRTGRVCILASELAC